MQRGLTNSVRFFYKHLNCQAYKLTIIKKNVVSCKQKGSLHLRKTKEDTLSYIDISYRKQLQYFTDCLTVEVVFLSLFDSRLLRSGWFLEPRKAKSSMLLLNFPYNG